MPESMSISVNGQSQVPPGFRFHPTEEELLHYYLRKKVSSQQIDLDVIRDVDLNKLEPWDIQEKCKIGTTPQSDWYFFSHKDKKYPTGTRTNRATVSGFWKATGRDKVIHSNCRRIGMRKTLVFYKGRAPHGQKSDWIMHEYRLDDNLNETNVSNVMGEATQEESWVVCRIFKKKDHHKTLDGPTSASMNGEMMMRNRMFNSFNEGSLEQILQHMGGTCKEESDEANNNLRFLIRPMDSTGIGNNGCNDSFLKLPSLESPNSTSSQKYHHYHMVTDNEGSIDYHTEQYSSGLTSWTALDRLVASQLNGQSEASKQLACFNEPTTGYGNPTDHHNYDFQSPTLQSSSICSNRSYHGPDDYNSEIDLWSFTRSSSSLSSTDPLCHVSNNSE